MVVSSILTPQAALLVPISGPMDLAMDSVVNRRGFTGSAKGARLKAACESRPGHL